MYQTRANLQGVPSPHLKEYGEAFYLLQVEAVDFSPALQVLNGMNVLPVQADSCGGHQGHGPAERDMQNSVTW